jgi:hypothetical protein
MPSPSRFEVFFAKELPSYLIVIERQAAEGPARQIWSTWLVLAERDGWADRHPLEGVEHLHAHLIAGGADRILRDVVGIPA